MRSIPESRVAANYTPEARKAKRKRSWGWVIVAAAVLIIGVLTSLIAQGTRMQPELSGPKSTSDIGHRAIVQVLQDAGIDVEIATSFSDAKQKMAHGGTLVMTSTHVLSDEGLHALWDSADTLVAISPNNRTLDELFGSGIVSYGGYVDGPVSGSCDLDWLANAETITVFQGYRVSSGADVTGCFVADATSGVVVAETDGQTRAAVDGSTLSNAVLADDDNAAFAMALLGQNEHLVWYAPNFDSDASDFPSADEPVEFSDYVPGWVTPVMLLLVIVMLTAAIWTGRRFGPLVKERLPVTVRAAETMEGRAKLYGQNHDARHASNQLRRHATRNLARVLGMHRDTQAAAVAESVAATTSAPLPAVQQILLGAPAQSDTELLQLSDRLTQLEAAVRAALGTERTKQ